MSFLEDTLAAPRPDALEEAASTPANLPIPTTLNFRRTDFEDLRDFALAPER